MSLIKLEPATQVFVSCHAEPTPALVVIAAGHSVVRRIPAAAKALLHQGQSGTIKYQVGNWPDAPPLTIHRAILDRK
jgi:hypothetical protein